MDLAGPISPDRSTHAVDDPGGFIVADEHHVVDGIIWDQRFGPIVSKPSCPGVYTMRKSSNRGLDSLRRSFEEDVDMMERGLRSLMMEKVDVNEDDEDDDLVGGKYNGGFTGLYGWLSPFKWDIASEQASQTQDNVGSRSSRGHDSQHIRSFHETKHSKVPTTSSDVSISHKTAHPESGSKNQRYAETSFGSRHGSSSLPRMKHVEVLPGMMEAGFLDGFGAVMLDKAIMIRSSVPRYIGLYPHSADPPLPYTEKHPEPEPSLRHNYNNPTLYHRPGRSNTIYYPKNYCHSHTPHPSLPGVQFVLKLVRGFIKAILRVVEAVTPAFVLSGLARIILLGRIFARRLLTRFRRSDRFHNHPTTTTQVTTKNHLHTSKMENTWDDDAFFEPLLNMEMLEDDQQAIPFEPELNSPNVVVPSDDLDLLNFSTAIDLTDVHPEAINTYMDPSLPPPFLLPSSPILASSIPIPETDWTLYQMPVDLTPEEYSRYFDFSTFPSMDPRDTNPGMSPTSQDVSPQTEGLVTPTFSPASGSSPCSIASPSATRKHSCGFASCGHKQFERPCDLNKHLKTHDKHLPCEFAKEGCIWVFCTKKDLDRHVNGVHKKKKPFSCHICKSQGDDKRFTRKDNWRVHLRKVHGAEV